MIPPRFIVAEQQHTVHYSNYKYGVLFAWLYCSLAKVKYRQVLNVFHFHEIELFHGPLTRYAKLLFAHAPGTPGTFSPPVRVSDPDMHHSTCFTHVPWYMPGSLTGDFLWRRWRGKLSRHSRRMRNTQFYVSGKRPIKRLWQGIWRSIVLYGHGNILFSLCYGMWQLM